MGKLLILAGIAAIAIIGWVIWDGVSGGTDVGATPGSTPTPEPTPFLVYQRGTLAGTFEVSCAWAGKESLTVLLPIATEPTDQLCAVLYEAYR